MIRENDAGSLNLDRGHKLKAGGTGIVKAGNSEPWAIAPPRVSRNPMH